MLEELMDFMNENKITFLRSASSDHELIVSHDTGNGFVDYVFDEECSVWDIFYNNYILVV